MLVGRPIGLGRQGYKTLRRRSSAVLFHFFCVFQKKFSAKGIKCTQYFIVRQTLDSMLAVYLRKKRGEVTYTVFAKKLGITPSSLFRLENGQQSITLKTLQQILSRLKVNLFDIFPPKN